MRLSDFAITSVLKSEIMCPVFVDQCTDVINYEKDIEPYRRIVIYSGVGSGKNTWVNKLAEETGKNILLITSRAITADAQTEKLGANRRIKIDELYEKKFSAKGYDQKIVVVTNAGIENYLRNIYDKNDENTHIWNYFDYIILDEAHSLATDAAFANSPFHVRYFLDWVYSNSTRAKIIYMTGSPDPINWIFDAFDIDFSSDYIIHDLYDKCHHIDPSQVSLHNSKNIISELKQEYERGNKVIYFANSVHRIGEIITDLTKKKNGIKLKDICISYSNMEKDQRNFPEELINQSLENEKYLREKELLKEEVKLFFTTSKNQEGININNSDIPFVVVEAQDKTSLIQMSGRVRNGIDDLAIVYDAKLHDNDYSAIENDICDSCLDETNRLIHNKKYKNKTLKNKLIKAVEAKFILIRYNILEEKFQLYEERIESFYQISKEQELLKTLSYDWFKNTNREYSEYWRGEVPSNILTSWFPYSQVVRDLEPFYKADTAQKVREFIKESKLINKIFDKNTKKDFEKKFKEHISSDENLMQDIGTDWKIVNSIIKKYGYHITQAQGKRKGTAYTLTKK